MNDLFIKFLRLIKRKYPYASKVTITSNKYGKLYNLILNTTDVTSPYINASIGMKIKDLISFWGLDEYIKKNQ